MERTPEDLRHWGVGVTRELREPFRISVECHAGYRGEESPTRFRLGDRAVDILEVVDRWLAPDYRYFKVRAADAIYLLRHDITSDDWELTLFESRGEAPDG